MSGLFSALSAVVDEPGERVRTARQHLAREREATLAK